MFSSAVSIGSRLKNWKTKPMCSRRSFVSSVSPRSVISVPAISTVPDVGRSSPARMCISVDFPEPDGPITAVSAPLGDLDGDAAECVDRRVALAVAARHVGRDDDGAVLPSLGDHGLRLCHVIASSSVSRRDSHCSRTPAPYG